MDSVLASKFQLLRVRIESDIKLSSVILVTSARAGDGKSLTAYGLTECLAKVGHRAALVDTATRAADERLPESFGRPFPIVSLSPDESGPAASREAIYAFVGEMRAKYHYTIIDAAPLMSNSVAMMLAGAVDAVLLAVRHGRAPSDDDELMVQTLKHAKARVLGVIASSPESIRDFRPVRGSREGGQARFVVVEPRVDDVTTSALLAQ